jgi:hypothetical protein
MAAIGSAGGRAGLGLAPAFAVGLAFLGDARRTGGFFTGFFLAVLVFLRVAALVTRGFLRVALVLLLAFFLVAIYSLPNVTGGPDEAYPWSRISTTSIRSTFRRNV